MGGVERVAVRHMSVAPSSCMIAGFVMLGSFVVMLSAFVSHISWISFRSWYSRDRL